MHFCDIFPVKTKLVSSIHQPPFILVIENGIFTRGRAGISVCQPHYCCFDYLAWYKSTLALVQGIPGRQKTGGHQGVCLLDGKETSSRGGHSFTPPTSFEPLSQYEPTCDRHFPMGCRRRACRRIVHTASQASSFLLISSPLETWSLRPFGKRFKVYSRCIGRKITWRVQLLISLIAPVLFFNPNFLQDPCT